MFIIIQNGQMHEKKQIFKNIGSQLDERVGTYFLIPVPTEVNEETVTNRLWHYTECKC